MGNKLTIPKNLDELFDEVSQSKRDVYYLAGGTDINIQIKRSMIQDSDIFFINSFDELRKISFEKKVLTIGALCTFGEVIGSQIVSNNISFLPKALQNFASPLLQNTATIGGNIANGSPTADILPILLALDTKLNLISKDKKRVVKLKDYFTGYKQTILKRGELIESIEIEVDLDKKSFYKKVSARKSLTIAKVSICAVVKPQTKDIKIAVGSLNEYARRLFKMEEYLLSSNVSEKGIKEVLKSEISPISDLRSDDTYRFEVCLNLVIRFAKEYGFLN